ncbi:molecular chaperone [Salmonella enterica]|nr:molecular chaperone [Salmonella enterica]HBJ6313563.1 molecular chaperone [Salmonella enterica subsp. diarizonae serovar 50:r:z]EIG9537188.1 molecular chaperone [Salmonella enterica]EIH0807489.1 molecular chaperone [Salmonella enterica]EIH2226205.1 molecular chaperone [Salmonella enterica]
MFMNELRFIIGCCCLGCFSYPTLAATGVAVGNQTAGVTLGGSRVIYPLSSRGEFLSVKNPQNFPILVKSSVLDEAQKKDAPFIITPPLFRLDGGQRNALSITRTGGDYPADRESVNWICVQGIPPSSDSEWASNNSDKNKVSMSIQMITGSCIKLFVRPEKLSGNPVDVADKVSWKMTGKTITADNPTPFYMNVSSLTFNGAQLNMARSYIPPFTEEKIPLPSGAAGRGTLKWEVIGDYGEKKEKTVQVN